MRVQVTEVTKNELSHVHDTMKHLKWLLQLFSLDSTEKRISRSEKWCYISKAVLTVIIFGVLLYLSLDFKVKNSYNELNASIVITDVIQMIFDYFQYTIDLFFIYKYGCETSQEYFKQYVSFDKILNLTNYTEVTDRVIRLMVLLLTSYMISSVFDFIAWYLSYGIMTPVVYGFGYVFLLIKMCTNLDLTAQIINVECRLRVIGDLVQDYYESCVGIPCEWGEKYNFGDSVTNKNWFYAGGCERVTLLREKGNPLSSASTINFQKIRWLNRCYLLLSEQCYFISNFYGIRLLLNSLSLLIDMIRFLNVCVRIAVGSQKTPFRVSCIPVISMFLRFSFCVVLISSLVRHCEKAYRQVQRIQSLADHILINKNPDAALRSSITELRDLVNSRPISFNMANFFRLSYSFLVSMVSTVVTYTIILLQTIE